jgi:hypothetical protein
VPPIYPPPREIELGGEALALTEEAPVLLPERASAEDRRLARFLVAELAEKHGLAVRTRTVRALPPGGPYLLAGALSNPLVAEYARRHGLSSTAPEGYALYVSGDAAVAAGTDAAGAFYGVQSLRQLMRGSRSETRILGARVRDWPYKRFRGIKLYLPGRDNIAYCKRFIRDFMALYKFNAMIVEMNAAMRFDKHPELNAGWLEFGRDMNYTRRERSPGPGGQFQDSANADTADFGILDKAEVADLARYAREHHIEFTPEIPSLTHSYYLLTRHRDLAEIQDAEWPDTYCPSEPRVYALLFDVLDEFIEATKPRMVHVGHDEWRIPVGACKRCLGKDPTELFAADLNRIHAHLKAKGVQTAIWGDHLIEALRGRKVKAAGSAAAKYFTPGALSPEQVRKLIPKDILMFNWFWSGQSDEDMTKGLGEKNEIALSEWGFEQVFGNLTPDFREWRRRAARKGILGGAPSSWAATTELNFGKDLMFEFLGTANLLWSSGGAEVKPLARTIQGLLPGIRRNLSAVPLPSYDCPAAPLEMGAALTGTLEGLPGGEVRAGTRPLRLTAGRVARPGGAPVPVGADASSLLLLHATERAGRNRPAFTGTWNTADTAELMGWYEVLYQDGLTVNVPLRYGVNILELGWARAGETKAVAYEAEAVECGGTTLFAFEWINPRFGVAVRELRVHGAKADNAVLLAAVSIVPKRTPPAPKPLRILREPAFEHAPAAAEEK